MEEDDMIKIPDEYEHEFWWWHAGANEEEYIEDCIIEMFSNDCIKHVPVIKVHFKSKPDATYHGVRVYVKKNMED